MMGIQIGGGEWLFGPEITARYGGGLMWIATVAIVLQVFYNIECGRYALYCGEPVFTGFMRCRPGPMFWMGLVMLLNTSSLIPGLSTHAAAMLASLMLDRPPLAEDSTLVTGLAYVLLIVTVLPVLIGGKVYNTLQWVMTAKVVVVLSFCLIVSLLCVTPGELEQDLQRLLEVRHRSHQSGPTARKRPSTSSRIATTRECGPSSRSATSRCWVRLPAMPAAAACPTPRTVTSCATKGGAWAANVGAIPSAVGGHNITLSHLGKVFVVTRPNLERWRGWWRYIMTDQVVVWGPGCFMGMALPAMLSLQFAPHFDLTGKSLDWAQSLITADGIRHAPQFAAVAGKVLWIITVLVGMLVMMPSQMSIVDDISRRWTDMLWSGSRRSARIDVRQPGAPHLLLDRRHLRRVVVDLCVSLQHLRHAQADDDRDRQSEQRGHRRHGLALALDQHALVAGRAAPRWYSRLGLVGCGIFYLGLAHVGLRAKAIARAAQAGRFAVGRERVMSYLGIDIGTSFVKGAILDVPARRFSQIRRVPFPAPVAGTRGSHVEIDPTAVAYAVRRLIAELGELAERCQGILLCGQMGGVILVDRDGRPRTNYLSWRDQRSSRQNR